MPKSKRNKQIDLSKTKKHGLEGKKKLYEEVRSCIETYTHLFIFSVNDMRNSKIKSVREQWKHSRFFIGKNKVMAKALGMNPEDEFRMNLHKIGRRLKGERGLFFSNQSIDEVLKWFSSYSEGDFARSGNRATETVNLQEGPLSQFPHNLEPYLRQLGLPTTLKKGIIHLVKDHTVCNVGDVLTPETAKIVKLLGYEMAEFFIKIECVWSQDGSFSDFTTGEVPKETMNGKTTSLLSTPDDVASMDFDEVEVAEPSDELIENIIMKNRRSLMNSKPKQSDNEASSNESSDNEEMTDFTACETTINATKSKETSETNNISRTEEKKSSETLSGVAEMIIKSSSDEARNNEMTTHKAENDSRLVENNKVATNINEEGSKVEEIFNSVEEAKNSIENENKCEKISAFVGDKNVTTTIVESKIREQENLVENNKATTIAISKDSEDEEITELGEETKITTDEVGSESSEDDEIPELVIDGSANSNISEQNSNDSVKDNYANQEKVVDNVQDMESDSHNAKRLSLDKSALQSPIMLEKRPKFSPKMTRSAMKAKKTVKIINENKGNDDIKTSEDIQDEGKNEKPARGRTHKRHSTGSSPAERTLRNRSIKIVKKKK